MPDRVFSATGRNIVDATEREYNGINWDSVLIRIAESQKEEPQPLSPELLELLKTASAETEGEENDEGENAVTAGKLPDALKKHQFKSKNAPAEDADDEDEDGDGGCMEREGDDAPAEKSAAVRLKKVHFASADQISAEALRSAKESGDEGLVKAILAARNDRRQRVGEAVLNETKVEMEKNQKLAARHAFRMSVVNTVTSSKSAASKVTATAGTAPASGFKSVTSMSTAERSAFAQRAIAEGFDHSYVEAMLGQSENSTLPVVEQIKAVLASNLADDTKRTTVAALIKTAKLTSEQVERQIRYWSEELGYQDKDWVRDLFTTKYASLTAKNTRKAQVGYGDMAYAEPKHHAVDPALMDGIDAVDSDTANCPFCGGQDGGCPECSGGNEAYPVS